MNKKILIFIILINVSYVQSSNIGIGQIVLYLLNKPSHTLNSMVFEKNEMVFFKIVRKLNMSKLPYYPTNRLKNIQKIFKKYQCSMTENQAIAALIEKNSHNTILKITYFGDSYIYYYSDPLKINNCDLVLEYEEKATQNTIPISGSGSLMVFKIKENSLHLIVSEEFFHMD